MVARMHCSNPGRSRSGKRVSLADQPEEALGERARLARPSLEMRGEALDQPVHLGLAACEPEGGRLADRERPDALRVRGRDQERDHTAVGVADEVRAVAEQRCQLLGLALEVDPLQERPGRVAPAVRRDHLEAPVERRPHRRPGFRVAHAAMDEDDPHAPILGEQSPPKTRLLSRFSLSQGLLCSARWSPVPVRRSSRPEPAHCSGA
jgi:hypothetical protein